MITFVAVGIIQLIEAEKLKYLDQLSVSCFYPEPPALRRRFVAPKCRCRRKPSGVAEQRRA